MATRDLILSCVSKSKILKWHIKQGDFIKRDKILATYVFTEKVDTSGNLITKRKLKAKFNGKILELTVKPNNEIDKGAVVARIQELQCEHNTIMKDMCCDCGADLRREPGIPGELNEPTAATVPVVHNILELKVSMQEAERLAKYDEQQLLRARKLVLVVDLDMTLIHTTVETVPRDAKDVYSFTLPGHQYEYHTKLRPGARKFLESISKFYELHIFTMGSRMYAHTVARCLDPEGKFFAHRIRSRDEFLNSFSKFHDLKALFPCGDHMVSIIDDREDVWNYAPNLISVKPYKYFKGSDDINDPFKPENMENSSNNNKNDSVKVESSNGDEIVINNIDDEKDNTLNFSNKEQKNAMCKLKIDTVAENIVQDIDMKDNQPSDEKKVDEKILSEIEITKEIGISSDTCINCSQTKERADLDDYLFYLTEILEKVHFSFYSTLDTVKSKGGNALKDPEISKYCTHKTVNPDVRVIVPELRRQTLRDSNIVFTGVVPTNVPLEKSKAWKTAISLGARVTQDVVVKKSRQENGLYTTHVIAARHGTHKAHKGYRNPDIYLVNPNWLWCAAERWEWPEESLFPVPLTDDKKSPVSSRQGTPQLNSFESKTKKISPLAQGFEIPGGYNPDHFLNSLPAFSKQELDAMDKEVEDLMLSGDDSESDGNKESSENSSEVNNTPISRLKRKGSPLINECDKEAKKLKKKVAEANKLMKIKDSDNESNSSSNSESDSESSDSSEEGSSSSDSDDTNDEMEDDKLGSLLENKLNE